MDRQELLRRYAANKEDKLLLAGIYDKSESNRVSGRMTNTAFLDMRQQIVAKRMLAAMKRDDAVFFGRPEGFERKIVVFLPDWMEEGELTDGDLSPLAFLRATFDKNAALTHRDFLGSLMGAGITRESVGDIHVGEGVADIAVLKTLESYLLDNLLSAGREKLAVKGISADEARASESDFTLKKDTVASLRLDSVVSAGFSMAREKAASLVEAGKVILNYEECAKPDREVFEGDVVSSRGLGKFILFEVGGNTRKGRTAITIKKYS